MSREHVLFTSVKLCLTCSHVQCKHQPASFPSQRSGCLPNHGGHRGTEKVPEAGQQMVGWTGRICGSSCDEWPAGSLYTVRVCVHVCINVMFLKCRDVTPTSPWKQGSDSQSNRAPPEADSASWCLSSANTWKSRTVQVTVAPRTTARCQPLAFVFCACLEAPTMCLCFDW